MASLKTKSDRNQLIQNAALTRFRSVRSGGSEKLSRFIKPMLASIDEKPFNDPDWIFEIKWDGYRAISEIRSNDILLYSRNGLSFRHLYPAVYNELKKIKDDVVLDGEIVVLNKNNKPDFQKLQQYGDNHALPIKYYVFDCLSYKGKSLSNMPLIERKKIVQQLLPKSEIIQYADHVETNGKDFFEKVTAMDLEGMIAKRASSLYVQGKRTRDWLKIKNHNTQEAIIAGYTAPRNSRPYFGALVLGIMNKGKLTYIGHTGTGFTQEILQKVFQQLQPLRRASSPFDKKIPVNSAVTWVEPQLVCNVKFTEITEEGILRHPVFMGLRIDKSAKEASSLDKPVQHPLSGTTTPKKLTRATAKEKDEIQVNGHRLTITNKSKFYWPDEKITKGDVLNYYNSIHEWILPYLKNRPQSLNRTPNGIAGEGFYQKDAGEGVPSWIKTKTMMAESANKKIDYIICNDLATLLYLNNLGCIEINPWNSRISKPDYPDYMVLDIDPSEKNTFGQVIETAQAIHEVLEKAGAPSYCKTSGATGLHIYVPLQAAYTYEQIRMFAEAVALLTQEMLPKTTTVERALNKRNGRIYLDHLQNKKGQTLASVYSVRPKPGATVSAPLLWKEVKPSLHPSNFTIQNMLKRINKTGDLFNGVLTEKTNLIKCLKNLGI
jgi:bifunctional non-homologous end joining protein LigD